MGESYCCPLPPPRKAGDVVTWQPSAWFDRAEFPLALREVTGRVVYVNERHCFYVAEADCCGRPIREAFKFLRNEA